MTTQLPLHSLNSANNVLDLRKQNAGESSFFALPFFLVEDASLLRDASLGVEKRNARSALPAKTSVEFGRRLHNLRVVVTAKFLLLMLYSKEFKLQSKGF